ncbi:hypothetical protein FRB98_003768 [Tulasnella sp. 332]|nr:hypothetical protein FRB98_003768 [Tulasnella sp. 332]
MVYATAVLTNLILASAVLAAPSSRLTARLERRREGRQSHPMRAVRPMIDHPSHLRNTSNVVYSSNWAGAVHYTHNAGTFNSVTGTFIVPTPKAASGSASGSASAWVGIDGDSCGTAILQTGVDFTITDGAVSYDAWYEWYPDYAYDFSGITINAGDSITTTVTATSTTEGTAEIINNTTGEKVSKSLTSDSALCEQNAEWIVEDFEQDGELVTLANFGTVTFTHASAGLVAGGSMGSGSAEVIDIRQNSNILTSVSVVSDSVAVKFAVWQQRIEDDVALAYPFLNLQQYRPPAPPEGEGEGEDDDEPPIFHPRYNIAPRSLSPIIRRVQVEDNAENVFQLMQWGVIPHWGKSKSNYSNLTTINARSEALIDGESVLWSQLKGKKRCVIPVNGYYEWLKKDNKTRVPYYTKHLDNRPMMFAGLWEHTYADNNHGPKSSSQAPSVPSIEVGNSSPTKDPTKGSSPQGDRTTGRKAARNLFTFAIITTSSNSQLSFIHDRMPVILTSESDIEDWLDTELHWSAALGKILKPYEGPLDCYQVPQGVGKVGTQDPSFVQPVTERKDGIAAMFKKQEQRQTASGSPSKEKQIENAAQDPSYGSTSASASGLLKRKQDDEEHAGDLTEAHGTEVRTPDDGTSKITKTKRAKVEDDLNEAATRTPSPAPASSQTTTSPNSPKKTSKAKPKSKPKKSLPNQKEKITDFFKK